VADRRLMVAMVAAHEDIRLVEFTGDNPEPTLLHRVSLGGPGTSIQWVMAADQISRIKLHFFESGWNQAIRIMGLSGSALGA
jgi:hypothetical protein